jgi:predicted nucleic acid-binding protein
MRFVLDASVTICWAMRDEDHPVADAAFLNLATGSAAVPGIWWYEVRNLLVMSERRQRISQADSVQFLDNIAQFAIQVDHGLDSSLVMELARNLRLTVYDASYLALALRERLPLATLDSALRSAAKATSVPLVAQN